jgi:hypothetical protein
VSERRDAGDVADGPDILGPDHPAVLVDLDRLSRADVQPQFFKTQSGDAGLTPRREDHPAGIDAIATDQGQSGAALAGLRRRHLVAERCRARSQDEIAIPDPSALDLHNPGLHHAPGPAEQPRPGLLQRRRCQAAVTAVDDPLPTRHRLLIGEVASDRAVSNRLNCSSAPSPQTRALRSIALLGTHA